MEAKQQQFDVTVRVVVLSDWEPQRVMAEIKKSINEKKLNVEGAILEEIVGIKEVACGSTR